MRKESVAARAASTAGSAERVSGFAWASNPVSTMRATAAGAAGMRAVAPSEGGGHQGKRERDELARPRRREDNIPRGTRVLGARAHAAKVAEGDARHAGGLRGEVLESLPLGEQQHAPHEVGGEREDGREEDAARSTGQDQAVARLLEGCCALRLSQQRLLLDRRPARETVSKDARCSAAWRSFRPVHQGFIKGRGSQG